MSTGDLILTIIESILIVAVVLGLYFEPAIARWEQKQKEKILKAFKERKEYRR